MAASLMLCYLPSRYVPTRILMLKYKPPETDTTLSQYRFRAAVTVVIKNYRPPADVAELGVLPWTRERTGKGCLDGMQFRQS